MLLPLQSDEMAMIKEKTEQLFSYLLNNSSHKRALFALSKILDNKIAFNAPHKLKIESMEVDEVIVSMPLIKLNTNHLGSIHACAMATMGEYPAGLLLIKNFGFNRYRLIMRELGITFHKQAVTNLSAVVSLEQKIISQLESELSEIGTSEIKLQTIITNSESEVVAEVLTTWHLKNWEKVKFKK